MSRASELAADLAGRPRLVLDAALDVSIAGRNLSVNADGELVTVALESLADAVGLFRELSGRQRIHELSTLATAAGLTVVITVDNTVVVRAGRGAAPGLVGRSYGVELRGGGLLRALLKEPWRHR